MKMAMDFKRAFGLDGITVHGRPLVYLDNGATTWMCPAALGAVDRFEREYRSNVHRGVHALAARATEDYEAARDSAQRFLGAARREEIVFTPGTTEGVNLVAFGWARTHIPERRVALPEFEHHANIVPWQRWTAGIRPVRVLDDGRVDLDDWRAAMTDPGVGLGAFAHISNVLGTVQDAKAMCAIARAHGKPVLIDAAQSAARLALDVSDIGCDWLTFSAHKLYGPTGSGVLWGAYERLSEMEPMLYGGDMIDRVTLEKTSYADIPARFEAGTPNISGVIGMAAACDWLGSCDFDRIRDHERGLIDKATRGLKAIGGITLYGEAPGKLSAVSFNIDGAHPMDVAGLLDFRGVMVRSGHHCAHPIHDRYGVAGSARASLAVYTTEADIDAFLGAVAEVKEKLL